MPRKLSPLVEQLQEEILGFYADPNGFVTYVFDWGHGELEGHEGPDDWQREYLERVGKQVKGRRFNGVDPVSPIREATASGHGIGKSALVAWLVLWILSTRPDSKGVVTANTAPQLKSKTWAELAKWRRRAINGHWFEITSGQGSLAMYHVDSPETWRVDGQTCREENSEAFAGLHAANSTPFYIFDEASTIPEAIWEVAWGGLTDGEPQWHVFGNPTRNSGSFFECFHKSKHRWGTRQIDSRSVRITNKAYIAELIEDHGLDSDRVRVRVLGQFPHAADMQFISRDVVRAAQKAEEVIAFDDPLIMGVDIARGGPDETVFQFRRGRCARYLPGKVPKPIHIPGEKSRNSEYVIAKIAEVVRTEKPDAVFVDGVGIGGPICDRLIALGINAVEIQSGGESPDPHCYNMRAYMWRRMKDWLVAGGAIDDDEMLEAQLVGPDYMHKGPHDKLLIEPKEKMNDRGLESPDRGDGLAFTFAMPVLIEMSPDGERPSAKGAQDYDPFSSR